MRPMALPRRAYPGLQGYLAQKKQLPPLEDQHRDPFRIPCGRAVQERCTVPYWGTSLIRNRAPLSPYSRRIPRALWWSEGLGIFL